MRLRLTPRDTVFYDQFGVSARNIVDGGRGPAADRRPRRRPPCAQRRMRDIEHANDENTHEVMRAAELDLRDAVRPRGHLQRSPAGWTTSSTSSRPPPTSSCCTSSTRCRRRPARSWDCSSTAAHVTSDAMPRLQQQQGPRGVLDRGQPPGERGRPALPADARRPVRRQLRRADRPEAQGPRGAGRGRRGRARGRRRHRRDDRRQGRLSAGLSLRGGTGRPSRAG